MRMPYVDFYARLSSFFRKKKGRTKALLLLNRVLTALMYCAYPLLLLLLLMRKDERFFRVFLIPAVSFALVSLIRKDINRPRPYETYDLHPLILKEKKGCSMPSRHVFSSAMIAMCWLYVNQPVGIVLLFISALSAFVRVAGGVHYPSDVVIGYLVGVLAGLLLYL